MGAASEQEALQVFSKGDRFDMALVNVIMPGMTGIELAKRLEALESGVLDTPQRVTVAFARS